MMSPVCSFVSVCLCVCGFVYFVESVMQYTARLESYSAIVRVCVGGTCLCVSLLFLSFV